MENRDAATLIAVDLLGLPYIWGGNDPVKDGGLDCSGFVGWLLRNVGVIPQTYDDTADGYWHKYMTKSVPKSSRGCLVFYGAGQATHVMFCLNSKYCIGATNGDHTTTSIAKAQAQAAFVKVRPINYRKDILGYVDPFKEV